MRNYVKKHRRKIRKEGRITRIRTRRLRTLFILKYLSKHGCIDCGETNPVCLEFDHIKNKKFKGISEMANGSYSEKRILEEIKKCVVRCANCHRIKTSKEYDWFSYIDFNTMTVTNNIAKPISSIEKIR